MVKEGDGGSGFEVTCVEGEHRPPARSAKGCTLLRVGSRRDALAQAQQTWQRRQAGINRQEDRVFTRRDKPLDDGTANAAACHWPYWRDSSEGHGL
jgi:hypothetical protein